jgi:hypothetical protein
LIAAVRCREISLPMLNESKPAEPASHRLGLEACGGPGKDKHELPTATSASLLLILPISRRLAIHDAARGRSFAVLPFPDFVDLRDAGRELIDRNRRLIFSRSHLKFPYSVYGLLRAKNFSVPCS